MTENDFRWIVVAIFGATMAVSITYRRRAHRLAGAIPRAEEGKTFAALRALVALPLYLSMLAYMIHPPWMAWSALPVPVPVRLAAAAMAALMVPASVWVFRSLGTNVSETVLTKEGQTLVTRGPYRWVRHPLYTMASLGLLALAVVAANGFMIAMIVLVAFGLPFVARREEAELVRRFGPEYADYMARTGRFVPRMPR